MGKKFDKGKVLTRTEVGVGFRVIVSEKTNPRHVDMLIESINKKEKEHENKVSKASDVHNSCITVLTKAV